VIAPRYSADLSPPKADFRLRSRGAAIALVLAVFAGAGAVPGFAAPADDLFAVGKKAFADGQYALAISSFERIQNEFPESPTDEEAGYLLGVSLYYAGHWAESLSVFSLFGIRHPSSALFPRASYWIGAASLKLGNYQTALDNLTVFLQRTGESSAFRLSAVLYSAIAQEGLGRDADAAAGYRELLRGDPAAAAYAAEATYRLAGTELRAGRYAAARDLYGRVLLNNTSSPYVRDSVFFAGECDLSLGNLAEAEKSYRTLLSLYPDSPYLEAATFRLADVSWRQKKPSALQQLDDFLSRFPNGAYRGSALRLRGDMLFEQKKPAEALAEYTGAASILPEGPEKQAAWYSLARAQVLLGMKLQAADSFARAGSGGSADIAEKAGFQRAVLLAGEGKVAEAIQALRSFLEQFPGSARAEEAGRLLGNLLEKQGNPQATGTLWDFMVRSFSGSPSLPEYLYNRGTSLLAQGSWASALDDFQRVLKDHPGSAWTDRSAYAIGYVYAMRGEYPRALPFFQSSGGAIGNLSAAITLFNMGRFEKAVSAFRALQDSRAPAASAGTVVLYIGRSLYRMGRLEDAAACLGKAGEALAAEGSPQGADAHYWRGWALLRLRKPADAYGAFLAVAEGYPADPRRLEALFRAGVCETIQSNDAAAVALYEEVINASPKADSASPKADSASPKADSASPKADSASPIVEQAMYERTLALARLGKTQESADALEQLAGAFPSGRLAAQALYARAESARTDHRFADAHADFDRVAHGFPSSPLAGQASYWSAESLFLSGDARGALEGFWACLTSKDASGLAPQAIEGFTSALHDLADVDQARLYAGKARSTPGVSVEAAAGVLLASADIVLSTAPEEARALIEDVRRTPPPEPYAGEASLLMGRYAALQADWNRSLDILGALEGSRADDIGARAALEKGRTLEAMGRTSDAVDEYLKVAYLFPDLGDRAAEGLANAARVSRARGDRDRADKIEHTLRKTYPASPWIGTLSEK
jgi:TolA-binding protein